MTVSNVSAAEHVVHVEPIILIMSCGSFCQACTREAFVELLNPCGLSDRHAKQPEMVRDDPI